MLFLSMMKKDSECYPETLKRQSMFSWNMLQKNERQLMLFLNAMKKRQLMLSWNIEKTVNTELNFFFFFKDG